MTGMSDASWMVRAVWIESFVDLERHTRGAELGGDEWVVRMRAAEHWEDMWKVY